LDFPRFYIPICLLTLLSAWLPDLSQAQVRVSGRVYDFSQYRPLEAVSVMTTSGRGVASDSLGRYSIIANTNDSIWFSYLGRPTPKYPITSIGNLQNFEISLHVNTELLKEVRVMPPSYRRDSIENRQDYAKAFNFQKPGIGSSLSVNQGSVGLDLDQFINMFNFRRNRRMLAFQKRLLEEEEIHFIDHRFSRVLIIKLTGLKGEELNQFIERYRPEAEFVRFATDYELQEYIKVSYRHYRKYLDLRKELQGK